MKKIKRILIVALSTMIIASCFHENEDALPQIEIERERVKFQYKNSMFLMLKPYVEYSKYSTYQGKAVVMKAVTPVQDDVDPSQIEYQWSIVGSNDVVVFEEMSSESIKWVPEDFGVFNVNLSVKYNLEEVVVTNRFTVLEAIDFNFNAGEKFQKINDNFTGEWIGKVDSPWHEPAFVNIAFNDDGSFSSKALTSSVGTGFCDIYVSEIYPFYYINDMDSPFKLYEIKDVLGDGTAIGELNDDGRLLQIKNIRFSSDFNSLFFDVWNDSYGPIKLSLQKYKPIAGNHDLAFLQENIIGKWVGSIVTPWVYPYEVSFEFLDDGTYVSNAESPSAFRDQGDAFWSSALYYGTDDNSPLKAFNINNIAEDGRGEGEIDIVFDTGAVNNGSLKNIELSEDGVFLKFEFWHGNESSPIKYVLRRK